MGIDQKANIMPPSQTHAIESILACQAESREGVSNRVGWGGRTQPSFGFNYQFDQSYSIAGVVEEDNVGVDARDNLEVADQDNVEVKRQC